MFDSVARDYDHTNDLLSFGIQRFWKDSLIQELNPTRGTRLLDCGGGTGDITFRYLDYLEKSPNPKKLRSHVTVCDINKQMLEVGKTRAKKLEWTTNDEFEINWEESNAEKLCFDDNSFNGYTLAFTIRHCTHSQKVPLIFLINKRIILIKNYYFFRFLTRPTEFSLQVVDFCAWNSVTWTTSL